MQKMVEDAVHLEKLKLRRIDIHDSFHTAVVDHGTVQWLALWVMVHRVQVGGTGGHLLLNKADGRG